MGSRSFIKNKIVQILFAVFLLFAFVHMLTEYTNSRDRIAETSQTVAHKATLDTANQLDMIMARASACAETVASELGAGQLNSDRIREKLQATLDGNPDAFGAGVSFLPHIDSPHARDSAAFYVARNSDFDPQRLLKAIETPFYSSDPTDGQKIKTGEVFIDFKRERIRELVSSRSAGKTGYNFLLSKRGVFISHPIDDYVARSQDIFTIAGKQSDRRLMDAANDATAGGTGIVEYQNELTGQASWISYAPVNAVGWSLASVFVKSELTSELSRLSVQTIWIGLVFSLFLALIFNLALCLANKGKNRLWADIGFISILLLANIIYVWRLSSLTPAKNNSNQTRVLDQASLVQFLQPWIGNAKTQLQEDARPDLIPTGIFVESLDLGKLNVFTVSGYVWQKYTNEMLQRLTPGFAFPDGCAAKVVEAYRKKTDDGTIIGWNFKTEIRHNFDYSKYPFDKSMAVIPIRPRDLNDNVVLVPDFGSYKLLNPASKPGVSSDLALSGWVIENSSFNYKSRESLTTFGLKNNQLRSTYPELGFSIAVARKVFVPCISNLLPVIIVNFILFSLLAMTSKTEKADKTYGLKTSGTIGSCSGLFFAVLLAHMKLRGNIDTEEFFYLEYVFFLTYFFVLLVAANALLFGIGKNIRWATSWIFYEDNLIPKLAYWPAMELALLGLTIVVFY